MNDTAWPPPPYRRTVYKGIRMKSRLEAKWAADLDSRGLRWEYEPCCFASERGQYLPDFKVYCRPPQLGRHWFQEVKGTLKDAAAVIATMARMEIVLASEPTVQLALCVGDPADEENLAEWCLGAHPLRPHEWWSMSPAAEEYGVNIRQAQIP